MPTIRPFAMIAALSAATAAVPAMAAPSIDGRWVTQDKDGIVQIGKCGKSHCGRIVRFLITPPDGQNQKDIYNPNPRLKKRKLLGLPVLTNFKEEKTLWRGTIYDPNTGKSYRSVIRRKSPTTIEVKGCIGPFCQTQIWRRAR